MVRSILRIGLIICGLLVIYVGINGYYEYGSCYKGPEMINISEFKGTILPRGEVNPGTFTIKTDFEEALKWGPDSLMIFGFAYNKMGEKEFVIDIREKGKNLSFALPDVKRKWEDYKYIKIINNNIVLYQSRPSQRTKISIIALTIFFSGLFIMLGVMVKQLDS